MALTAYERGVHHGRSATTEHTFIETCGHGRDGVGENWTTRAPPCKLSSNDAYMHVKS